MSAEIGLSRHLGVPDTPVGHEHALALLDMLEQDLKNMVLREPRGTHTVADVSAQMLKAIRSLVTHHKEWFLAEQSRRSSSDKAVRG